MFNMSNCVRDMYQKAPNDTNEGCVCIIKPSWFKEAYRMKDNQLFRVQGGFGAGPSKMGNACYGYFCIDGEQCRIERYDFIGVADEETTKYAEELEKEWKDR